MNRREITTEAEGNHSAGKTLLWSILTGIGFAVGFLVVTKMSEKLERKQL